MKILQVCKKTPVPPKDGESIAIHQLSKSFLNNKCQLHVFSLLTNKHKKSKSKYFLKDVKYSYEKINTSITIFGLLKNLFFSSESYIIERFYKKNAIKHIVELVKKEDFDIIQLEGVFLGNYIEHIQKHSKAKIVLRSHNIEYKIWERFATNQSFLKRYYLEKIMIPRLKNFEDNIAKKVDCIVPISCVDEKYYNKLNANFKTKTLPAAYEVHPEIKELPNQFNVGFIGGLDWQPNAEGVKWFLRSVWKKFVTIKNNSNFNLAGRNFPRRYYDLKDTNLYIYGEIEDAQDFTYQNSIMIAPILSGSGMRIKIIEAMALGRTVVSTRIGAEGINYENNKNIFIADTAEEWIEILVRLSEDKDLLNQTALEAQKLIKRDHDINKLGKDLVLYYQKELL